MFNTPFRLPGGLMAAAFLAMLGTTETAQGQVVISKLYGAGGAAAGGYQHDFVELFNTTDAPFNLNGYRLQYASNTGNFGTANNVVFNNLDVIPPRGYFLIRMAGGTLGNPVPLSDWSGGTSTVNMAAAAFKIMLVNGSAITTNPVDPATNPAIIDFVGVGTTANIWEGAGRAPATSNTAYIVRNNGGCRDTNNNNLDFTAFTVNATGAPPIYTKATSNVVCPGPEVTSSTPAAAGTLGVYFYVTFDTTPSGLTAGALTVDGSPATSVTGSGRGPYIFSGYSSPVGPGPYTVTLNNAGIERLAGETMAAPYTISVNSFSDVQPTPVISSTTVNPGDVTKVAHNFTVTFSEGVTGFAASDISVTNGTLSAFAADTTNPTTIFTFTVTPITLGPVVISIPEAAAFAIASPNNPSDSATFSWTNDPIGPRVNSQTAVPAATQSVIGVLSATFDEPLVGFTNNDLGFLKNGEAQDIATLPFSLTNGNQTVTIDVSALTVDEALYGVLIGTIGGGATDALGNPVVGPALIGWTKDNTAPAVTLSGPVDNTIIGTSAALATTLDNINGPSIFANSGLVSRRLEVQTPGSATFVDSTLLPVFGNYSLTFTEDGRHSYRVVAEDEAGNVGTSAVIDIYVNRTANAAFTQTVTGANETLVWPQTNDEDITIALTGATVGATINVERQFAPFTKPSNFDPAKLSNERLLITQSGLGTFTATLTWDYDAASVGSIAIDHVYRANNGGPLNFAYPVTPSGGRVVATGIDGFSEWYLGESTAGVDNWSLMAE